MDDERSNYKRQKTSGNEALDKFDQQTKNLSELGNDLREHVSVEELKEMLRAKFQEDTVSVDELVKRCADGMMFGALSRCPKCSGYFEFHNESYRCRGSLTGFSTCTFTSRGVSGRQFTPGWSLGKVQNNRYLTQWHHNQSMRKTLKDHRLLKPESQAACPRNAPTMPSNLFSLKYCSRTVDYSISTPIIQCSGELFLEGCMFDVGKFSVTQASNWLAVLMCGTVVKAKLKESVQAAGASSAQAMSFLFWNGPFRRNVITEKMLENEQLREDTDFRRLLMKKSDRPLPMVREQFLLDCLKQKRHLPIENYTLEPPHSTRCTELLNQPVETGSSK